MRISMKFFAMLLFLFGTIPTDHSFAEDKATPTEIIMKVKEAAVFLSQAGESGLSEFENAKGRWVWKDTYIFVCNCAEGSVAAHPDPKLIGKKLTESEDNKGNLFFAQLCDAAKKPGGGWSEYWWTKPGKTESSRKISLMLQVPNTPYQVGAGIYDDEVSAESVEYFFDKQIKDSL